MERKRYKVLGVGELLWDVLPEGKKLGGAPCNFAYHMSQAGFDSFVVSAVGNDKDGEEILEVVKSLGLSDSFINVLDDYDTGTVLVEVDSNGIPNYIIKEKVAWDFINCSDTLLKLASEADAVCYGSLAQRNWESRSAISNILDNTKQNCLRIYDVNLRQSFYSKQVILDSLKVSNILKLNDEELPIVANLLGVAGSEREQLNHLLSDFNLKLIAYTKGSEGSLLLTTNEVSYMEVPKVNVIDTVGAGDTFTAILIAGLLKKIELKKIHQLATEAAAYVCTQTGATPELPNKLIEILYKN